MMKHNWIDVPFDASLYGTHLAGNPPTNHIEVLEDVSAELLGKTRGRGLKKGEPLCERRHKKPALPFTGARLCHACEWVANRAIEKAKRRINS